MFISLYQGSPSGQNPPESRPIHVGSELMRRQEDIQRISVGIIFYPHGLSSEVNGPGRRLEVFRLRQRNNPRYCQLYYITRRTFHSGCTQYAGLFQRLCTPLSANFWPVSIRVRNGVCLLAGNQVAFIPWSAQVAWRLPRPASRRTTVVVSRCTPRAGPTMRLPAASRSRATAGVSSSPSRKTR